MKDLKNKKIIATGGEGFIGKYLVQKLKDLGARVKSLDLATGFDVTNWQRVKKLKGVDLVFHLAAFAHVTLSYEKPREVFEINLLGTLNILDYCRIKKVKKLIFASSCIYGHPIYLPVDEKHPVNPVNPYAKSKAMADELCQEYAKHFGLNIIILRPFNVYGEGQKDFLIPVIIDQILKKNRVILGHPEPKRDYIYIADMIEAYLKAALYNKRGVEIFNIGSGKSYSVREVAEKIINISGKQIPLKFTGDLRKNEIMDCPADIRKASKELGWRPKISFEEGLKKVWQYSLDRAE